jgi:hypothetical protein
VTLSYMMSRSRNSRVLPLFLNPTRLLLECCIGREAAGLDLLLCEPRGNKNVRPLSVTPDLDSGRFYWSYFL